MPGEVAPEENALAGGLDDAVNLGQKINVDLVEAALRDEVLRLPSAELVGFIRADVYPGRGELLADLVEPLLDERERTGLDRREHLAMRRLGERRVLLVLEDVVEMAEGFLLRHDGDVILRSVVDKGCDIRRRHGAPGWRDQRRCRVAETLFEVGRVDVELVGGQCADLALLELECGDRAAGEIVIEATMRERWPVADAGGLEPGFLAVARCVSGDYELLYRLGAIEEAGRRGRNDGEPASARNYDIALVVHRGLEGDVRRGQQRASRWCVGAQQFDDGASGAAGDGSFFQCGAQVFCGEAVLRIAGDGPDEDAVVERENAARLQLARHRDELQGRDGLRVQRRKWGKRSDKNKQKQGRAAGGARDICHSIL